MKNHMQLKDKKNMIEIKKEGILLNKTELEFENEGVLNPAVIARRQYGSSFYRAVRKGEFFHHWLL